LILKGFCDAGRWQIMKKKGFFITFEGIEGSGKTTQIKLLADWLRKKGRRVVLTREPGGTPLSNRIRSLLLSSKTKGLTPAMELFLYEVARRDHVSTVIQPALKRGSIILCDRFTDATMAYQGYGRGLSLKLVEGFNKIATGGLKPDLTFLFDLPVEIGLQRANRRIKRLKKGSPLEDRFEQEKIEFHNKVREGYLTLARKEKRRFVVLDARKSKQTIFAELCDELGRTMEKIV
jgi:dTMP kinase